MGGTSLISIFQIVVGAYAIYAAISGKGMAYKNDYPENVKAHANKLSRIFFGILGPLALIVGIIGYINPFTEVINRVIMIAGLSMIAVAFIVYLIVFRVRFGKYL